MDSTTLPDWLFEKSPSLCIHHPVYCGTVLPTPVASLSIWSLDDTRALLGVYSTRDRNWASAFGVCADIVYTLYHAGSWITETPGLPLKDVQPSGRNRLLRMLCMWSGTTLHQKRALLKRSNLHPILSPLWEA